MSSMANALADDEASRPVVSLALQSLAMGYFIHPISENERRPLLQVCNVELRCFLPLHGPSEVNPLYNEHPHPWVRWVGGPGSMEA